jgi:hypothetical protein
MNHWGIAWLMLCVALALHVLDEALTNFLSVYNPTVRGIRTRFPYLPLPTFTFSVWLTLLILAVLVLFASSPLAFRGATWMWPVSCLFAVFMMGNGLLHIGGSLYTRRLLPGVYSSPLLIVAATYLLASVLNH